MFDPIDDGVDPDQAFSDDFCRLLREGLITVEADDVIDALRFPITVRGRAELSDGIAGEAVDDGH